MVGVIAWIVLGAWTGLVFARGWFWLAGPREESPVDFPSTQPPPKVIAVIPARDEAATIGASVGSLLGQDYPGVLDLVVVDDVSRDETSDIARNTAASAGATGRLAIVEGSAPPFGWTGKVWAQKQGVACAMARGPDYLLLTDADIVYAPDTIRRLVSRAAAERLVLVSVMAKLHCNSFPERCVIPAFVFFFEMLYPFRWVNKPGARTAAGAGGCMLVKADALAAAGGIEAIRGELIDDCALARRLKPLGPIWLGLGERVRSIRAAPDFTSLRRMVVRSAYAQLGYSPARLVATVAAMGLVYLTPPLLAVVASGLPRWLGLAAYALMALAFQPTLRLYRGSPSWGLALPLIAALYTAWTIDSAVQYARGRGGMWKGRAQAVPRSGVS